MGYFLGIPISRSFSDIIHSAKQQARIYQWNIDYWHHPADFHLTLCHFKIPPDKLGILQSVVESVVQDVSVFSLFMDALSILPVSQGKYLALMVDPNPELLALEKRLTTVLAVKGYAISQRIFMPHISLAKLHDTIYDAVSYTHLTLPTTPYV